MLDLQEPISERYHLQQHVHHGMMSDVYLAYDQHLQCDVAIKLVCNDQIESMLRFQSEIQTLRTLTHDNILPILDYGEYDTYHYLVMPYMRQGTLFKRISKGRVTEEEAGSILAQVTSALQYTHDQGILHRDIKPSNILLESDNERYVYLADFGLAKAIDKGSNITQTGCLIGTPEYMAPELIDKPESISSDIYALGILLYHMLTGQPPFRGNSALTVCWKHLRELPIPPSQLNPAITAPVEQVILRALHKDPQQRFLSAKALAQAYTNALQVAEHITVARKIPTVELAPAHITPSQVNLKIFPTASMKVASLPKWQNQRYHTLRASVCLVLVAIFVIPFSLGFLLGRERTQESLAFSGQFASAIHQGPHAPASKSTPPPTQTTPTIPPLSVKTIPQRSTPSSTQHKHKHKHKHHHGNENTIVVEA